MAGAALACGRVEDEVARTEPGPSLEHDSTSDGAPVEGTETSLPIEVGVMEVGVMETGAPAADAGVADGADDAVGDALDAVEPSDLEASPTGDDTTGDGSHAHPFKTVTRAIGEAVRNGSTRFITVAAPSGSATFGDGCTGGAPCDATPIVVPATLLRPLMIRAATGSSIVATGGGDSIFRVDAPGIGFADLTIRPTKLGKAGKGGHGIVYAAPAAVVEGSITNVVVEGIMTYEWEPSTGHGIWFPPGSGAGPTLGPGLMLTRGYRGVTVQGDAHPRFVGDTRASPSGGIAIGDMADGCIVVDDEGGGTPWIATESADADEARNIRVRACGRAGLTLFTDSPGISTIADVVIDGGQYGIVVGKHHHVAIRNTVVGGGRLGLFLSDDAVVALDSVDVQYTASHTVSVAGNARLVARTSRFSHAGLDGIHFAGGSMMLRDCALLDNAQNGLWLERFAGVDLGNVASPGDNVFDETSRRNGRAGICLIDHDVADVFHATFSCAHTDATCSTSKPPTTGTTIGDACATGVDLSFPAGSVVTVTGAMCCD